MTSQYQKSQANNRTYPFINCNEQVSSRLSDDIDADDDILVDLFGNLAAGERDARVWFWLSSCEIPADCRHETPVVIEYFRNRHLRNFYRLGTILAVCHHGREKDGASERCDEKKRYI